MSLLFVAGAGTDIGKTYVTAALVRACRDAGRPVRALKPLASGLPEPEAAEFACSDTAMLLAAQGMAIDRAGADACSPWRFRAPLSPDMAARAEERRVELAEVAAWCAAQARAAPSDALVLVEGVGGVMSPVTQDATNRDLITALGCPALLVCGTYLGAISHALTALEALRIFDVDTRAVVLNESAGSSVDFDATAEALARFTRAPIAPLRRAGTFTRDALDRLLGSPRPQANSSG